MEKLGVGLLGCGGMGRSLAQGLASVEAARLVAVWDKAGEAAAALAEQTGARAAPSLDELLADEEVGAVIVAAPQFAHAELTVAAAEAGKHVFCEKPMATTLAECDRMVEACRRAGVVLMIGQVCRYHAVHGKVRELVASGEYGRPVCITVHRLGGPWSGAVAQPWRLRRETSGGNLMEINAHEIDFMRWVFGDVARVQAAGGTYVNDKLDYPDVALVVMEFKNGAVGFLHSSQASALGGYGGRVDCSEGSLDFPAFWGQGAGVRVGKFGGEATFIPASDIPVENPVAHELRDFVASALAGHPAPVPGEEGRAAVEIALAAYRSIETGSAVDLPLEG